MDVRSLVIAIGFKVNNSNVKQVEQTTKKVKTGLERVGDSADKAGGKVDGLLSKLSGLAMFAGVSLTLGSIVKTIDEWKVIEGQVNNVTKSQQESKAVQKEIYNIASRTRQQYGSTAELFTSVARNAQELKKSTKDILLFTEDVSNAMLLGGGDASSQQAALVQLGQALGSGTLRGDELNSIMEQAPRLAKAIAEGMGTTIGQLRQMGSEGKLTAQDVFNAIRGQSDRLKMELGKMPWTIGQASNKMQNAIGKFFKEFEDKTGIIDSMAKSIAKFADYVEKINLDNFISGLRIAAIYAGVLFGMAKWSSFVMMLGTAVKWIVAVRDALMLATGAQIVFNSQTRKGAAMQMLIMGKFLLIAAAIAFVVLLIQDFYKWITDPTADTMMKRWFGDFDAVKNKANEFLTMLENSPIRFIPIFTWIWIICELIRDLYRWFSGGDSVIGSALTGWGEKWQNFCNWFKEAWDSVSKAFEDFCNMRVIDIIKLAINWLGKLSDKIAKTARSWGESLKEKFGGPLWPSIQEGFSNFVNKGVNGTGPTAPNDLGYYGKVGFTSTSSTTSVNNSGNQQNTFYITGVSNPKATGEAVVTALDQRSNGGLGNDINNAYPAV
nr:MAG TPA: Tail tape measure [Caudoviricetes sp.]